MWRSKSGGRPGRRGPCASASRRAIHCWVCWRAPSRSVWAWLGLRAEGQAGRLAHVVLDVKEVRALVGPQAVAGVGQEPFGLVAGDLHDRDRQALQGRGQLGGPGRRVTSLAVDLQEDEVADGLDAHQADLGMEGLVLTDGDRFGRHLGRQVAALAGAVVEDRLLELARDGLLGAEGTGDEPVQAGPPKELANQAEAARPLLGEGQMAGTDQPMQERQARRALEERDQGRIGIESPVSASASAGVSNGAHPSAGQRRAGWSGWSRTGGPTRPLDDGTTLERLGAGLECRGLIKTHGSLPVRVVVPYQHEQASRARLSQ